MVGIVARKRGIALLFIGLAVVAGSARGNNLAEQLSAAEQREIAERLRRFYAASPTDGSVLNERAPKYDALTGQPTDPHPELRLDGEQPGDPLQNLAQAKGTERFQRDYCEQVLRKHFPDIDCEGTARAWDETAQPHDRVEKLLDAWMPREKQVSALDDMPSSGHTGLRIWSDDYWRMKWGLTSYRYAHRPVYRSYEHAVGAYAQPSEWQGLVGSFSLPQIAERILSWSPSEKYDLSVGDEAFSLTLQQKARGRQFLQEGTVADWMGLCHGWAAAAVTTPPPTQPVKTVGARGVEVTWYPSDVRAMATLSWGSGLAPLSFVGGRCDVKKTETHPNGRLKQAECFDTSPATFHAALANLIGRESRSFIMDKSFDYQVWNQPLHSYSFRYFNPLDPSRTSNRWRDVAAKYDAAFKSRDRFQRPLTRGQRTASGYDDSKIQWVVGVQATVVYVNGANPVHGPRASQTALVRETFTYDLEVEPGGGKWVAHGGEWHLNAHPDFLWVPKRDALVSHELDKSVARFVGSQAPPESTTRVAQQASALGYPLCRVVQNLVSRSAGEAGFRCAGDPAGGVAAVAPGEVEPVITPAAPAGECRDRSPGPVAITVQAHWPDTQVWFEGQFFGDFRSGNTRTFNSPPLQPCRRFQYNIRYATWRLAGGQWVWITRNISIPVQAYGKAVVRIDANGEPIVESSARD